MNYFETVIGLEIHIELSTKSKMFCSCSADYFGKKPNTHTCPICLGLPGALPLPNRKAIEYTQQFALAVNCQLQLSNKFDRKNYFYPDLPKGFQISQYDKPFSQSGYLEIQIDGKTKRIGITRAHLEEDTGKLSHATINGRRVTLIDFNRSGVPLMEVVSEPDINSAQEAKIYSQKLQQIVRYLKISDADMEKGSMRIEPNVSLRKVSKVSKMLPSYKVELKNINSFKFAEKAINFEIERQRTILESGKTPDQETRGWDEKNNRTLSQRGKELAHDYRYFPEPDLTPFTFSKKYIKKLHQKQVELPEEKFKRFSKEFRLSDYEIAILIRNRNYADYFEEAVIVGRKYAISPAKIAKVLINKKSNIEDILPVQFIKKILQQESKSTFEIADLESVVKKILRLNPKTVIDYQKGKLASLQFLIGQVQKETKGKSDAKIVKDLLLSKLDHR